MILSFTGHRPSKLNSEYDMDGPVSTYVANQIDQVLELEQPTRCLIGMAIGVDIIAALCCLSKGIPITACIPFKGQESMWPEKSQYIYNKIINHKLCTKRYVCTPGYAAWKMQTRNEYMVNNSNKLVAVFDTTPGGTANCVKYAKSKEKEIIYIDPSNYSA